MPVVIHLVVVQGHEGREIGYQLAEGRPRPGVSIYGTIFLQSAGNFADAVVMDGVGVNLVADQQQEAQVILPAPGFEGVENLPAVGVDRAETGSKSEVERPGGAIGRESGELRVGRLRWVRRRVGKGEGVMVVGIWMQVVERRHTGESIRLRGGGATAPPAGHPTDRAGGRARHAACRDPRPAPTGLPAWRSTLPRLGQVIIRSLTVPFCYFTPLLTLLYTDPIYLPENA